MRALSKSDIAEVWVRMASIYGHRWVSSFGTSDTGDTWLRGLSGLTPQDLAHGLEACVRSEDEWPPSLPLFRRLCLGLPEKGTVIAAMLLGDYRGAVAGTIAKMIGAYDLKTMDMKTVERRANQLYSSAVDRVVNTALAGRRLPAPSTDAVPRLATVTP